jgi:hypothetical protein
VEPAVSRHDTPTSGMPALRNYSPLPNPGNRRWHPNT